MYVESRKKLVAWLRRQLIGPAREGSLEMSPLERYPTGVLHPIDPGLSGLDPASAREGEAEPDLLDESADEPGADGASDDEALARPPRRRRYVPPSSVGFSCYVRGEVRLAITASAAIYQGVGERGEGGRFLSREYTRTPLPAQHVAWRGSVTLGGSADTIWNGRAGIDVRARPHGDGTILTVTLCNRSALDQDAAPHLRTLDRVDKALFEARVECVVERGDLVEYPRVDPSLLTDEEQELELQYREQRIYAIGHGAAADWEVKPGRAARVWSDFLPEAEVPMVTVDTGDEDAVLGLAHLAELKGTEDLERFADGYADWIAVQGRVASDLPSPGERATANRVLDRMGTALERMRKCVEMLRTDPLAAESFQLANRAMLDQMRQADHAAGRETGTGRYRWRPFQLAFLLAVMESAIREDDDYRDVLDPHLVFRPVAGRPRPTSGSSRSSSSGARLKYPDSGAGTAAFHALHPASADPTAVRARRPPRGLCPGVDSAEGARSARRSAHRHRHLGRGGEISPNTFYVAGGGDRGEDSGRRFPTRGTRCCWNGVPGATRSSTRSGATGRRTTTTSDSTASIRSAHSARTRGRYPATWCATKPSIGAPPSLLIATIDKFARIAWEERTGAFFGAGTGSRPPELVIQDELHLITGPLGSVAGAVRGGPRGPCSSAGGVRPKYIASTATIRMAAEQVRRLYARELAVFPPPGLLHDDSYFARTDRERPGRLFVGYLAPMLDQQHCLAPLAAALLAGPEAVFDEDADRDALLDAWWTQVVYHGSLKGVGNSHNAFTTNVRDFGQRLASELEEERRARADGESNTRPVERDGADDRFRHTRLAQLTSRSTAEENAGTFHRLAHPRETEGCLDAVLATNMVSVGLDVARLALMVVNGQPLTTAEYIQASSRVGRADVPGLVFANYYRHQARSLSHYESFRPYHESFYRFVEPSSVTPFTYQVRSRALHAALVVALRHACAALRDNSSAGNFDQSTPEVRAVIAELARRCERAADGTGQGPDTASHIERLAGEWHDEARRCEHDKRQLKYESRNDGAAARLLYTHGEPRPGLWATLHSMRNVEGTGTLKVHDWPPR